jgi:hypothetical protein
MLCILYPDIVSLRAVRAGADARPAGDLVERDAKTFGRERLLRGPQDPLGPVWRVWV